MPKPTEKYFADDLKTPQQVNEFVQEFNQWLAENRDKRVWKAILQHLGRRLEMAEANLGGIILPESIPVVNYYSGRRDELAKLLEPGLGLHDALKEYIDPAVYEAWADPMPEGLEDEFIEEEGGEEDNG